MSEDRWHQPLVHVRSRELSADTGQTSGMTRREATASTTAPTDTNARSG